MPRVNGKAPGSPSAVGWIEVRQVRRAIDRSRSRCRRWTDADGAAPARRARSSAPIVPGHGRGATRAEAGRRPSATVCPGATSSSMTRPARGARTSFCIFIASIVRSAAPSSTSSPSATATATTRPGRVARISTGPACRRPLGLGLGQDPLSPGLDGDRDATSAQGDEPFAPVLLPRGHSCDRSPSVRRAIRRAAVDPVEPPAIGRGDRSPSRRAPRGRSSAAGPPGGARSAPRRAAWPGRAARPLLAAAVAVAPSTAASAASAAVLVAQRWAGRPSVGDEAGVVVAAPRSRARRRASAGSRASVCSPPTSVSSSARRSRCDRRRPVVGMDHQLGEQRVVLGGRSVSASMPGVDPNARARTASARRVIRPAVGRKPSYGSSA